jgi:4-oxalocrotonate tautomerase
MVEVAGGKMRPVMWVPNNQVEGGDWAIGVQRLAAADVYGIAVGTDG